MGDLGAPRLLDLFCGAGGAGAGYRWAGFDVTGLDIHPQPRYPFAFEQGDAIEALRGGIWRDFDAIHASPPCQHYSPLGALSPHKSYPDLIAITRTLLIETGLPFVIENVMSAPLDKARSVTLCGGMFGLRTYRHRRFEPAPGMTLTAPEHPKHLTVDEAVA